MVSKPKELIIISGKGGTGKTSIAASFAALAGRVVLADCDVDAADLHLVLSPKIERREEFRSGHAAVIRQSDCAGCGDCVALCRFNAVRRLPRGDQAPKYAIDPLACEGCGVCVRFCPEEAIDFPERTCGEWFVSETRCGPMVHARLGIAAENSGKLVSLVRAQAREVARARGLGLVLIDGAPGIGCPVIASITGTDLALVVTEPTLSGLHDLERVSDLTRHFHVETLICVNKWDLNEDLTSRIETLAHRRGLKLAGRVRYDQAFTDAQIRVQSVVEYAVDGVATDIRQVWSAVLATLKPEAFALTEGAARTGDWDRDKDRGRNNA
jgi:MinD superfamily P-loop ATPase